MTTTPVFWYTINNVKVQSRYDKTTARELLEMAVERGAIDGVPEGYILQSLKEDVREYKPEDTVDLSVDNAFIALMFGSTLVA